MLSLYSSQSSFLIYRQRMEGPFKCAPKRARIAQVARAIVALTFFTKNTSAGKRFVLCHAACKIKDTQILFSENEILCFFLKMSILEQCHRFSVHFLKASDVPTLSQTATQSWFANVSDGTPGLACLSTKSQQTRHLWENKFGVFLLHMKHIYSFWTTSLILEVLRDFRCSCVQSAMLHTKWLFSKAQCIELSALYMSIM